MKRRVGILSVLTIAVLSAAGLVYFATATTDAEAYIGFERFIHLEEGNGCEECPVDPWLGCGTAYFCTDPAVPGDPDSGIICLYNCFGGS